VHECFDLLLDGMRHEHGERRRGSVRHLVRAERRKVRGVVGVLLSAHLLEHHPA
jgi:hypothetical protein